MEFTLKSSFNASAEAIYNAWLSSEGHSDMTGGEATISNEKGGEFSAWDGYFEGKNIVLEPCNTIVQSWRTSQFESDEPDSQIEILLDENNGKTELTLIHTNLPESGGHYKKGWEEHYFQPMKEYFG